MAVDPNEKDAHIKEKNKVIKLTLKDNVLLYIANMFGDCGCCFDRMWKKKKKLQKMYEDGSERLDAHLDVLKIVKSLKKLKILMENSMMTEEMKKEIKHSEKNVIYLDDDDLNLEEKEKDGDIEIP